MEYRVLDSHCTGGKTLGKTRVRNVQWLQPSPMRMPSTSLLRPVPRLTLSKIDMGFSFISLEHLAISLFTLLDATINNLLRRFYC